MDSYLSGSMLKAKVAGKRTFVHKNQAKKCGGSLPFNIYAVRTACAVASLC